MCGKDIRKKGHSFTMALKILVELDGIEPTTS